MRILIDTNVLIDYISKREPYFFNAEQIITLCANEKIYGCIAAHSVMDAIYITRKEYSIDERKNILKKICLILDVVGVDKYKIINSLSNDKFTDIEDCLQMECAKEFFADYIVTRNIKDFKNSVIKPIMPDEFLKMV